MVCMNSNKMDFCVFQKKRKDKQTKFKKMLSKIATIGHSLWDISRITSVGCTWCAGEKEGADAVPRSRIAYAKSVRL
jgi:hypothetical protein